MVEVKLEEEKKVRCLLVGAPNKKAENPQPAELMGLVKTLGMEIADVIVLNRIEPTPTYGIGSGKAQEIADRSKDSEADCIIFDWEIDPSKQRNWERLVTKPVFDRNEVIIRIFAQRAQTKEALLQVNLAKLTYSLPRLSHMYGDMARQRGGNYGSKGSGETQAELDRRQIEDKILQIKKELEQVQINRNIQRKQRERTSTFSCSLVGYTNAGKSSLLNALTGADVFVENELFATLDPTTRKLSLSEASTVLLTDTVGFISNLPHTLIDAFKSTLEETALSDLLLITVDASDENCIFQYQQVQKVLKEIHADHIPQKILLNKIDSVKEDPSRLAMLASEFPEAIKVSAKTQEGFEELLMCITENLLGTLRDFIFPINRSDLVELCRKNGTIEKEEWLANTIKITARIPGTINSEGKASTRTLALVQDYIFD
ncbi:GTPase HflX [Treponema sp.]|uniref:GTPase HflX n=1 Tax=Treponema sp. TaxID=166 RepID=UPI0025F2D49E|nr:GTPase HflX [Treponema sp.]MCR5217819.1 GTPase HflX [Treponema sp.]